MKKICNLSLEKDIYTNFRSHQFFSELAYELSIAKCEEICLDFSKIGFFASNQFAILGCILGEYLTTHPDTRLYFRGLSDKLTDMIKKNGFSGHFGMETLPDIYNTVVPYKIFQVHEIKEYEAYLTLKIFNRDDLPLMSPAFRHNLQDSLLEIFKNVSDHTSSQNIYTCGQFFPRSSLLYFTIVDNGETIPYNVTTYFSHQNKPCPANILEWALMEGTTTAGDSGPRGIGLYLIESFIQSNKGQLYIVSGKETYEVTTKGRRTLELPHPFPGTIVTLAFNLKDSSFYNVHEEEIVEIQF